jgi:hypothetical protein
MAASAQVNSGMQMSSPTSMVCAVDGIGHGIWTWTWTLMLMVEWLLDLDWIMV